MRGLLVLLVSASLLSSCKMVEIENGEVPPEYLSQAKKLEGVYRGAFDGNAGDLAIVFQGNRPVLSFRGHDGGGLLPDYCHSEINSLKWASVNRKGFLDSVGFHFDPGTCKIEGREVVLYFGADYNKIDVRLLQRRQLDRRCRYEPGGPGRPPYEVCENFQYEVTLKGRFSR